MDGEGETVCQAVKGNKGQKQTVSLPKEAVLLCSARNGVALVSDGYNLFYIHNGLAKCSYKALHKIRDLLFVAEKVFVLDENIVASFDKTGRFLWQYWHSRPINRMAIKDGFIELVDENSLPFRISVKKGKLDEQWTKSVTWSKWNLGREGWKERVSDSLEKLSVWMNQTQHKVKTRGKAKLQSMLPLEYRISLEMNNEKRAEDDAEIDFEHRKY